MFADLTRLQGSIQFLQGWNPAGKGGLSPNAVPVQACENSITTLLGPQRPPVSHGTASIPALGRQKALWHCCCSRSHAAVWGYPAPRLGHALAMASFCLAVIKGT